MLKPQWNTQDRERDNHQRAVIEISLRHIEAYASVGGILSVNVVDSR
jgi:hypothetical protein